MKLPENPTIKNLVIGGTAASILGTIYLITSEVRALLSPDNKAPTSENAQSPLHQYQNQHRNAAQMLEDGLNGK